MSRGSVISFLPVPPVKWCDPAAPVLFLILCLLEDGYRGYQVELLNGLPLALVMQLTQTLFLPYGH